MNNKQIFHLLTSTILFTMFASGGSYAQNNTSKSPKTVTDTQNKTKADIQTTEKQSQKQSLLFGLVLQVNDDAVTSTEIVQQLYRLHPDWPGQMDEKEFARKAYPVVSDLVMARVYELLMYQHAREELKKAKISDEALKKIQADRKKEFLAQFGGSEEQARQELAKQGMTMDDKMKQIERDVAIAGYRELFFTPTLTITRSQLLRYYRLNRDKEFTQKPSIQFQLIDIRKDKFDTPEAAAAAAHTALEALKKQVDFATVAKKYSQGFRKRYGGLWQPYDPAAINPKYRPVIQALERLKPDEITGIIETKDHFFIAKLIHLNKAETIPFCQAQTKINDTIREKRWKHFQQQLTRNLLAKSVIGNLENFIRYTLVIAYERGKPAGS